MVVASRLSLAGFGRDQKTREEAEYFSTDLRFGWLENFDEKHTRKLEESSEGSQDLKELLAPAVRKASAPALVYGAGLLSDEEIEAPFVLLHSSFDVPHPAPLHDIPAAQLALETLMGNRRIPESTLAYSMPRPEVQCGPGYEVECRWRGTLGMYVTTGDGRPGALTAGHVGCPEGAQVVCLAHRSSVGSVTFSSDPATKPIGEISADVAVVEVTSSRGQVGGRQIPISGISKANGGDVVRSFGAQTNGTAVVEGRLTWLRIPGIAGFYADLYQTKKPISRRGDSGAPVLLGKSDQIVGHIVAGTPNRNSFIQDVETQLAAGGARFRIVQ
jgi:hypothetical protein